MRNRLHIFISLCLVMLICAPYLEAQSKKAQPKDFTVYGNVKSAKGIPLMGVEITVQDSFINTVSDENGDFSITIPSIGSVLVFYTDYYNEAFQTILSTDYLQIIMYEAEAGQGARDKVNMPYWTTQKRNVTASLNTISWDDFDKAKVMDMGNALQGRVLGMNARLMAGAPGFEETTYIIRGNRSLNGMDSENSVDLFGDVYPIIIVDGFERDFEKLDPHEIESFSILRDAAATAIYGNRGANGVILVNTRHGETNKRTINFSYFEGLANPVAMPDYVDAATHAEWYNEALVNDGYEPLYTQEDIDLYRSGKSPLTHPNTDFYDSVMNKFASQRRATVSFNGGNQIARYFVLIGYSYQKGLWKTNNNPAYETNSDYGKYNIRSNVDINITKWLRLEAQLGNRILEIRNPCVNTADILNEMHNPANSYPLYFTGTDPELNIPVFMLGGDAIHLSNPYGMVNYHGYSEKTHRYYQNTGRFVADFSRFGLTGLGMEICGHIDGWNYYDIEKTQNFNVWKYSRTFDGQDVYTKFNTENSLSTSTSYNIRRYYGAEAKLTYSNKWGDHSFSGLALFTRCRQENKQNNNPDFRYENYAMWLNYSFRNRYFMDVTGSYAGSDKFFYTNNRREFYPSVGLGWIISSEPWMKGASWLNYLKMRASWGISGNNNYKFTDTNGNDERYPARARWVSYDMSQCKFGTSLTSTQSTSEGRMPNPNIRVEKGEMVNWALELAAFRHRLNFEVDIWYEHRYDIYTASVGLYPKIHGAVDARMAITNDGIVDSQGIEVELSWADKVKYFSYSILGQFSYCDGVMKNIGEPYREYDNLWNTGNRPRMDYGFICTGIFKDWDDINNSPPQMLGTYQPGDLKYEDLNKDGVVDMNDITAIGAGKDPRMQFNLAINLQYRNVGLDILFQGTGCMSNYLYPDSNRAFYDQGTAQNWMAGRFHYDADGNSNWETATYPRFTAQPNDNNWQCSTFWMKSSLYLRLKNVELSYHLPEKWFKNIALEKAKIYVSSYNPLTWSPMLYYNVDAEDLLAGIQRYPRTRTFNIGVDLTF